MEVYNVPHFQEEQPIILKNEDEGAEIVFGFKEVFVATGNEPCVEKLLKFQRSELLLQEVVGTNFYNGCLLKILVGMNYKGKFRGRLCFSRGATLC